MATTYILIVGETDNGELSAGLMGAAVSPDDLQVFIGRNTLGPVDFDIGTAGPIYNAVAALIDRLHSSRPHKGKGG